MRVLLFILLFATFVFAEIAKISTIVGDAMIQRGTKEFKVNLGTLLEKNDIITTKSNSKLQIIFNDNTIVTVGKSSKFNINDYIFDEKTPQNSKTDFQLLKGTFRVITGKIGKINRDKFKLKVKSATIGIRGTNFIVRLERQGFYVTVTDGGVYITHPDAPGEKVLVDKNETAKVVDGKIEVYKITIKKKDEESSLEIEDEDSNYEDSSIKDLSDENVNKNISTTNTTNSSEKSTIDTATDVTEETDKEINASSNISLNGKILGAYIDDSLSEQRAFIRKEQGNALKATRVNDKLTIDDKISKKYEQSNSNHIVNFTGNSSNAEPYDTDNYTGSLSVGTFPLSYEYESYLGNSQSVNSEYNLQADNLGEFFIAYKDNGGFKELFVVGKDSTTSSFDTSKIYSYDSFSEIKVIKDSNYNINSVDIISDKTGTQYYNPLYDSFTNLNYNFYEKGAQEFTFGDSNSANTYRNKYIYSTSSVSGSQIFLTNKARIETASSTADISIKGSKSQGLMYSISTNNRDTNYSTNSTSTSTIETLGGSYLDNNDSVTANNSTTNLQYSGYLVGEIHGKDNKRETSNNLQLNIEKNSTDKTVNISASGTILGNSGVDLALEGNLGNKSAYYINDDLFGVMGSESIYKISSTDYNSVDNSAYLLAVPDGGFDLNDNPLMLDDESSWGYWTAKFDDSNGGDITFVDTSSTWVAGVETASSIVDSTMLNIPGTYDYKGHVLGNVLTASGNIGNIIYGKYNGLAYTNKVNLRFDIGSAVKNLTGNIEFSSTNSNSIVSQWNLSLTGTNIENSKFGGTISGNGGTGSFEGKYYGTSSVKSVGGTFNATNSLGDNALGVFKAVKQ